MPGFMRSSSAAFGLTLAFFYDALLHLVHAVTVEDRSEYQACLASPSTCTQLCASLPSLERGFEFANAVTALPLNAGA